MQRYINIATNKTFQDFDALIWYIIILCSLLFIIFIGRKSNSKEIMAKSTGLMFNVSLTIGVLFFINIFGKDSGWLLSINTFTVTTMAILGVPGIVAIVYINFLRNL